MELAPHKKIVNDRKPFRISNRSNYFDPNRSKHHIRLASPNSYNARSTKIEAYQLRLFWEYRYIEDHDGQAFYYTLTYNDKACPKDRYLHKNCFDYNDLVWLLNGGFKKRLLREYGTNMKYFVGAELGEGKGKRGIANNPHYHIIFFLCSAYDKRYENRQVDCPYKKISALDFRHLVRDYWQGFDQDVDGRKDFREARYGIAKEGSENLGLITDSRAVTYAAKYVTKDSALRMRERAVYRVVFEKYDSLFRADTPLGFYILVDFWKKQHPENLAYMREWISKESMDGAVDIELRKHIQGQIREFDLVKEFDNYVFNIVSYYVREAMREYRNRFCNKTRISNGVGEYALDFIEDPMRPQIYYNDGKEQKFKLLPVFLYRKKYCKVVNDAKGQPCYILNKLGQDYKSYRLDHNIQRLSCKIAAVVDKLDGDLYCKAVSSDVNTDVSLAYHEFLLSLFEIQQPKIFYDYAIYKMVYEDRFFEHKTDGCLGSCGFPPIDVHYDFYQFNIPSYYKVAYRPSRLSYFIQSGCQNFVSYNAHPYFLSSMRLFSVFDLLLDYFFVQRDIKIEQEAKETEKTRRYHKRREFINTLKSEGYVF